MDINKSPTSKWAAFNAQYIELVEELDALMTGDPDPKSPEGLRAQEIIEHIIELDKQI
jgi:hypothetical protein